MTLDRVDLKLIAYALRRLRDKMDDDFAIHPYVQDATGVGSDEVERRIARIANECTKEAIK